MTSKTFRSIQIIIFLLILGGILSACGDDKSPAPPATATPPAPTAGTPLPPTLSPTPIPPSPTPIPLAATVNGEPITLAEFQIELALYQASGVNLASDAEEIVLNNLIDLTLLAQAAREAGYFVDDATLQARIDQLGAQAVADWAAAQGYTDADFRRELAREITAAWMRDKITAEIPASADQAHARQILLYNSSDADQVLAQIRSGADFANLAAAYDPVMAGELGWFPRGYLTETALEDAAFALQPGEYSSVIQTRLGYHILQVIERDPQRPLSPDARLVLQEKVLHDWLAERRSQSQIQIIIP